MKFGRLDYTDRYGQIKIDLFKIQDGGRPLFKNIKKTF